MGDRIAMCCGTPMIWTYMFRGAEWYCRKCKRAFPMLNAPERVPATSQLESERDANREWFAQAAADCIPEGARVRGCPQCDAGDYHRDHATAEDLRKSAAAYEALRR